jgi:nicotinamidase-related amidase
MDLERIALGLGNKPALVLIDMINGFTSSTCPLGTDCPEVVAANKTLLDAFRAKGLPVLYTTVVYHNDQEATVFRGRINALNVLTPDSDWVKVDTRLKPIDGEPVIEKCWASGFFKTDLDEQLRAKGADSIVVTGLTTSGCVRATVVDGLQNNFPVVVPEEAVGDRNAEAHAANLHDMHAKYAEVQTVQNVLDHLEQL